MAAGLPVDKWVAFLLFLVGSGPLASQGIDYRMLTPVKPAEQVLVLRQEVPSAGEVHPSYKGGVAERLEEEMRSYLALGRSA